MQIIKQRVTTVDGKHYIKNYVLIKSIGAGSFSKCWKVRTQNSNNIYALKIISKKSLEVLEHQKLIEEIKIHQSLIHPHIVHLDHWFENQYDQFIFLEYCQNGNLDIKAQRHTSMPEQEIRHYTKQILQAIKYLHSKNILHRDLKLPNFFIDKNNDIKLGDFGFACKLQYTQQKRRQSCGTPNYIAPQVVSGYGYSFPSDIWSFGVILYRLKYGLCPFETSSLKDTLLQIKLANYTFPKRFEISKELQDLIQKILVVNYDDRLTIQQIQKHPFFNQQHTNLKKSSSITRITNMITRFFSPGGERDRPKKTIQKIDSCQTLRDIKKIFKQKTEKSQTVIPQFKQEKTRQYNHLNVTKRLLTEQSTRNLLKKVNITKLPSNSKILEGKIKNSVKYITQFYPSVLIYLFQQENGYLIFYLTNGIRQIMREQQIYIISKEQTVFNKVGELIKNIPKTVQYIIQSQLKENKFNKQSESSVKITIQNRNFITQWNFINNKYYIMYVNGTHFMTTDNHEIYCLYVQSNIYLYNTKLEIVIDDKQSIRYKKIIIDFLAMSHRSPRKMLE